MKFLKKYGLYFVLLIGVLIFRGPALWENFKLEGTVLKPLEYEVLSSPQGSVVFPPPKGPVVVIFWASWCAPCKLEMKRLAASVESGRIPKERIFAINAFEDKTTSFKFIKENAYPFVFLEASSVASQLKVAATPTTALIENGRIISLSSGMSLIGIWRAEALFW